LTTPKINQNIKLISMKKQVIWSFLLLSINYLSFAHNRNITTHQATQTIDLKITIKNYTEKTVLLAYLYGGKTYIKDTLVLNNRVFTYASDEPVQQGAYKIVLEPNKVSFDLFIDTFNHHFEMHTDANDIVSKMVIIGSKDNQLFYDYLRFINLKRSESEIIQTQIKQNTKSNDDLENLNKEVIVYQDKIIKDYPKSFTTMILKGYREIEVPDFNSIPIETERQNAQYLYYKKNYFNNIDLSDDRLVRTDFFDSKIDYYIEKLTYQTPDSIKIAVDFVINKAKNSQENYKYLVIKFLNKYATSNIICMDAVYVHIGEKYYCNPVGYPKPDWIDAEQLQKICDNVNLLKPSLCGVKAPNSKLNLLTDTNLTQKKLFDFKSNYKVLFFWDHTKSNYHEIFNELNSMYPNMKSKGVEIIAIAVGDSNEQDIRNYLRDYNVQWINTIDFDRNTKKDYNFKATPTIYILDSNNYILYKNITYDQIEGIISNLTQS
jgi:hypothetical protein